MCILQLGAEGLSTKALADRPYMKWGMRGVVGGVIPLLMMSQPAVSYIIICTFSFMYVQKYVSTALFL